jgi:hypothetical protein
MKDSEENPPMLPLLVGCLLFSLMFLWSFWWFALNFSQLIEQFTSNASLIEFNKGAFYGLGAGIGLAVATYGMVHQNILKFSLDSRFFTKTIPAVMVSGVFISFLLPPIAHYSLEYILENRGYMICDLDSHQWRMYRTFYYVSDVDTCTNLIESKK